MSEARVLLDGLGFPESTRWREGRVWFCNWGTGEVISAGTGGDRRVEAQLATETLPFSIDWLPDGRLLIIDGPRQLLLLRESDGILTEFADLTGQLGEGRANELVVDGTGNAYVNGGDGAVVVVTAAGHARRVADGLTFPNGMALINDEKTLIAADSHAQALIAYDRQADGSLSPGRTWAELEDAPDGICADAAGAIWVATVPGQRCVRVAEGGDVLATVAVDRGCFACMLGGENGRTLFIAAAVFKGMEVLFREGPGRTGRLLAVPDQPAPHAGRP